MNLSNKTLGDFDPESVELPRYDRSEVKTGIVHIGPSRFARGHIFKYIDDLLEHDPRWGIRAISLRTSSARDALEKQDYLYSLTEQGADGVTTRIIGSLIDVVVAQETPQEAVTALTDPDVKLVTLTVTQAGYDRPASTRDITKLTASDEPGTVVDYLVEALDIRRKSGAPPLTIMSCDNLPNNGQVLRNNVIAHASEKSKELRQYIERHIAFPSTMVDRIVPSDLPHIFNKASNSIQSVDACPIYTEEFCQWVVEDNFSGDMPDLAMVGARVVDDVIPFERMKIRVLNGAHMALGCIAGLAGYKMVHEAMNEPVIEEFVRGFMDEMVATLDPVGDFSYRDYEETLIKRLKNPALEDQTARLARNGTQKLHGRILEPLMEATIKGLPTDYEAFAVAAWIQYLKGRDLLGNEIDIIDEEAVRSGLQQTARESNGSPEPVILKSGLFDVALEGNKGFVSAVGTHLHNIQGLGMTKAIHHIRDVSQVSVYKPIDSTFTHEPS